MDSILSNAREVQELVMVDRVRIERVTEVFDRATGETVETVSLVWEGKARLPRADAASRIAHGAGEATPADPVVLIPWNVEGVRANDRVTVTNSVSPGRTGRVLWVTDTSPRTFQSAIHLTCREVRNASRLE